MRLDIPETQELLVAARSYLNGRMGYTELHGFISQCELSRAAQEDRATKEEVVQWRLALERSWNEFGLNKQALTEQDFKQWVQARLAGLQSSS